MAVAMREKFAELATRWSKLGFDLGLGIGIATGFATLGRIGFEGRYDYGMVGAAVIVASRLSSAAEANQILLNPRAYAAVEDMVEAEEVGHARPEGLPAPDSDYERDRSRSGERPRQLMVEPDSYFVRVADGRYRATQHTAGAWSTSEQHFSPLGGLMTHALDRFVSARGSDDLVVSRLTFDILGVIAIDEFDVTVEVVRAGRTIELLEVIVTAANRSVVRSRAWRLARHDTAAYAGGAPQRLPHPDGVPSWSLSSVWPGGYVASLDVRRVGASEPGRGTVWLRTPLELVAGERVSPLARFVALIDTANGIATRVPPTQLFYPNVDTSVFIYRQPEGDWTGLDTTVVFGPDGVGLTSTVLHDVNGPVGRAEQTLTIRGVG